MQVTLPEILDLHSGDAPDRDGLAATARGGDHHWQHRHTDAHRTGGDRGEPPAQVCVNSEYGLPRFRCRCHEVGARCCEHANAEDGLCEPCRRWC